MCGITGYLRKQHVKIAVATQFVTGCASVFVSLLSPSPSLSLLVSLYLPVSPSSSLSLSLHISSFFDKRSGRHFFSFCAFFAPCQLQLLLTIWPPGVATGGLCADKYTKFNKPGSLGCKTQATFARCN